MKNAFEYIKKVMNKNSLLVKMVLSYVVSGSILIFIYSLILIQMISSSHTKDMIQMSEKYLLQMKNTTELLLANTNDYFYQAYQKDQIIYDALYSDNISEQGIRDITNYINQIVSTSAIVKSIYIYNSEANIVLTNNVGASTINEFFDKDIISKVTGISNYKQLTYFLPRKIPSPLAGSKSEDKLLSTIYCEVSNNVSPKSAMIVNIDQEKLQKLVNNSVNSSEIRAFIFNNNGNIITDDDVYAYNTNISNEDYVKKVFAGFDEKGNIEIKNENMLFSFYKSNKFNLYFSCLTPYSVIRGYGTSLVNNIIISTLFFLITGLIIAFFFGLFFYKPLNSLVKTMKDYVYEEGSEKYDNEYLYLKGTFNKMANNLDKLQNDVEKYAHSNKNILLRKIIHGEYRWTKDSSIEMLDANLELSAPYFCVLIFSLDSYSDIFEQVWQNDIEVLKYGIINISKELMENNHYFEIIDDIDGRICIVLKFDALTGNFTQVKNTILDIQENINKYFNITFSASIGDSVNNVHSIKNSYDKAVEASQYRLIYGKNSIIEYADINKTANYEYEYPMNFEKKIIDNIKLGDLEKINSSFDGFVEQVKKYQYDEIFLSLNQLILAILNTCKIMDILNSENEFYLNFGIIQAELKSYDTLDEIKAYIQGLFSDIINVNVNRKERKNINVINRVIELINEKYNNPALSIDMLADEVSLTPNYVRVMFKEVTNQSVSSYIASLRFNRVSELLLTTNKTVKEIVDETGFSTTGYFFTAFKKYFGCTPDQYRKKK